MASEAFNNLLMKATVDPARARDFAAESARITSVDAVINHLDEALTASGLNKAQLARAIGANGSAVRRFLSARSPNPATTTSLHTV